MTPPQRIAPAPALVAALETVKIRALATGLQVDEDVLLELGGIEDLTVHEYATTGGITLRLPLDVLVNAPFDQPYCATSDLRLTRGAAGLELQSTDTQPIPVLQVLPLPGYIGERDATGALVSETTMSHADRIRVSPIDGCAYDCAFCNVAALKYRQQPVAQILRGIDVALADEALPPRHLLISGGSPSLGHEAGQEYFRTTCLAVLDHLRGRTTPDGAPFEVDIMMSARPDGVAFVREMVAAGVTGFSLNIEAFSAEGAARHLPLKHKRSREHLGPMLETAAELLGADTARVRSLIIPGLETSEQTLEGVEWLASLGCSPVLSPFRPAPATALADAPTVPEPELRAVLEGTRRIAAQHGVRLGPRCIECGHNTLHFPWDSPDWIPS